MHQCDIRSRARVRVARGYIDLATEVGKLVAVALLNITTFSVGVFLCLEIEIYVNLIKKIEYSIAQIPFGIFFASAASIRWWRERTVFASLQRKIQLLHTNSPPSHTKTSPQFNNSFRLQVVLFPRR